jgi:hypothetical protein
MVMSNADFAKHMMQLADPKTPFQPTAIYDRDGDCIEFLAAPDPFYAERVDDLVTVYYSQESGEIIGSLLKGVSIFCRETLAKMPGFRIEIHDGRVKLEHIFRLRLWSSNRKPEELHTITYQKLITVAEQSDVETDNLDCLTA